VPAATRRGVGLQKDWHPAALFEKLGNHIQCDWIAMGKSVYHIIALCFFLGIGAATCSVAEAASPLSPSSETNRLVCGYALTSANDFPQRDPYDWRLLASHDGGRSWATLDIREGEYFSERHQRRIFTFTNNTAYNLFRFQIDRVRDPATADAVQLADLEIMGKSNYDFSPTPLFSDRITSQGDNRPAETVQEVFDSQVETKWLDTANQYPGSRASWIQWQYLDHSHLVITNIGDLLSLQKRADESYPVRIHGVVVGPVAANQSLYVLDASGQIEIIPPASPGDLVPGQEIRLEGVSQWKDGRVEIGQLKIGLPSPAAAGKPAWIEPGQTLNPGEDLKWVETQGQVEFLTRSEGRVKFELSGGSHMISVYVLNYDPLSMLPQPGAYVRVNGLSEGVLNANGERVAGILWLASLDTLTTLNPAQSATNANENIDQSQFNADKSLFQIDQIRRLTRSELAESPRVRIRGVITETSGGSIQDGTGGIEIRTDSQLGPQIHGLGAYVELEGRAIYAAGHGVAGYGPVIQEEKIRFLGNGQLPVPTRPSWSLLASGQMDAQWVEVDGVVRATDGSHLLLACESGELMATINSAPVSEIKDLIDASVRVRGVSVAATDERGQMQGVQLVVPSMEFLQVLHPAAEISSLPVEKISGLLQVRGPRELIHRVKVQGVLTGFENNNYFIQDDSGSVMAVAKQNVTLSLPAGGWWAFWQSPQINTGPRPELQVGDQVIAVGFPEMRGYAPVLTETELRKTGPTTTIVPVKATAEELAKGNLDATLVSLDGLVLGSETLGSLFMLQIQSGQRIFQVFLPLDGKKAPDVDSGSRVRITGVCQMEPTVHGELGKSPSAFSLLLRGPSDIAVLAAPAWLTVRKALLAVGALIVVLLSASIWIRLLHRQVEARTQQLRQEIVEHEKTEKLLDGKTQLLQREVEEHEKTEAMLAEKTELLREEIKERKLLQAEAEKIHKQLLTASRMAGMNDVATNVLHNVGNVLNGVNVLVTSLAIQVQKSKIPGVSRLAGLLTQHQEQLAQFLAEDVNGKHVVGHLDRLGTHLAGEQSKLLERIKLLTESVQHVKEIVAMQQNYARVSGVWETVSLAEIVDDALKLCGEALIRHEIELVQDYGDIPPMTLDRHKVLQILFNLVDNAKYACEKGRPVQKRITVKIHRNGEDRVRIEIKDNGIGIPPENLGRIFAQGFSTRADGHGFGLHGSILAAQDMGGSLTVHSDGPGQGAVFVLELPLTIRENSRPKILAH
jgi:signal transduction histidine kinase